MAILRWKGKRKENFVDEDVEVISQICRPRKDLKIKIGSSCIASGNTELSRRTQGVNRG